MSASYRDRPEPADVVVVGGGPAGAITALELRSRGLDVVLVEATVYQRSRVGGTVPGGVRSNLERLGLWDRFLEAGHLPSSGLRGDWGADCADGAVDGAGWHVDRSRFDGLLAEAGRERGVALLCETQVRDFTRHRGLWTLGLATPIGACELRTRFVVDATGRAAALAQRLGAARISDDALVAIVGFLRRDQAAADAHAVVEAVEEGWWYSAPLPRGRHVAAFITDAEMCRTLAVADTDGWHAAMGRATRTGRATAGLALDEPLWIVSAGSSRLDRVWGAGWLAVGDAATAWDPLSGQGVHKALCEGTQAARAVAAHLGGDGDWLRDHAAQVVCRYEAYRARRDAQCGLDDRWPDAPFWIRRRARVRGIPVSPRREHLDA